ncbi:MAG: hypothetical protein ACMUIG_06375 [Thermoplasmatota archaeon]
MGKGLGIASLVTGICAFVPIFYAFSWILATVAIITGVIGRKDADGRKLATIGMWFGIVWWAIVLILAILGILGFVVLLAVG